MEREFDGQETGTELGVESAAATLENVEAYCAFAVQTIELTNRARILALRHEGSLLVEEERDILARLRLAPPPGDRRSRKRRAIYYWAVTVLLSLSGLFFSLYTFAPFRIGWVAYGYCLGIAAAPAFLLGLALEKWDLERLVAWLASSACLAAIASLALLALIRGDLLAQELQSSAPAVVIDDAQPAVPQPQNDFYDKTLVPLRLALLLLAVAMDLGAGLALHEAWRVNRDDLEDWPALQRRLTEVRGRMTALVHEITELETEGGVFRARFWRNFYRASITHTLRSAMTKLLLGALAFCLVGASSAKADTKLNLVIAVDLSRSVAVHAPGQPTEFQKNVDAVTRLLAQVPASSRITIIGITDHSFTQPNILLSATISDDPGYFGEKLASARAMLVRAWQARNRKLEPRFSQTDIIGALLLASQIFTSQTTRQHKVLVIYSDMQQSTTEVNLKSALGRTAFLRALLEDRVPVANLGGVQLNVRGVDDFRSNVGLWQSLRETWTAYFEKAGTALESYTALRGFENLATSIR
jgi:hypothetical protein